MWGKFIRCFKRRWGNFSMSIRVLIADDSAYMRQALKLILEEDPEIQVIESARNGQEAIEKVRALHPDVLTTELYMSHRTGFEVIETVMKECPLPILVISTSQKTHTTDIIRAMEAGAAAAISPRSITTVSEIFKIKDDIIRKVKILGNSVKFQTQKKLGGQRFSWLERNYFHFPGCKLVIIGLSTGGPFSLQKVMKQIPENFPLPILIIQHMPARFTRSLAERLNSMSPITIVEAEEGMALHNGTAYIAPGGKHLYLQEGQHSPVIHLSEHPKNSPYTPSVDITMQSAHQLYGGNILGVIMTGMGKDGLEGCRLIKKDGGKIIAQDEESSIMFGMPKAVIEAGLADAILSLEQIAQGILTAVSPYTNRSLSNLPLKY
ncbi:MAG: chemotaxis-specific protein-glutamate methyltransferase CheB [Calditrichaeota bacterium]|nr:MAG: chemotaxis-specific protein-glutamate methyltransferase CheB [Calditrichota bacterium]